MELKQKEAGTSPIDTSARKRQRSATSRNNSRSLNKSASGTKSTKPMNSDIQQLLGKVLPKKDTDESIASSHKKSPLNLHNQREIEVSLKTPCEGHSERSTSKASVRLYNLNSDFCHDVMRTQSGPRKKQSKIQEFKSVKSTIVMPQPVPEQVQQIHKQQVNIAKQFPIRENPVMRAGDNPNYGYRIHTYNGRKLAINQQLLIEASVKLSLDDQKRPERITASQLLKEFKGAKMKVIEKENESAIVEIQGVGSMQAGVRGSGSLKRLKKPQAPRKIEPSNIDKAMYIQRASQEELRSCFSPREVQQIKDAETPQISVKAQILASPRQAQSEIGSENTERLPTDSAINKTIDKTKDFANSSHYYNGSTLGAKKRAIQQAQAVQSQPIFNQNVIVEEKKKNELPQESSSDLQQLNTKQIKIDVKHKPNMGGDTQIVDMNDLDNSQAEITVERLAEMRESYFASSNLSQQSFYDQMQMMAQTQRDSPSGPYPQIDQSQHATARGGFSNSKLEKRASQMEDYRYEPELQQIFDQKIGREKRFTSIYGDKKRAKNAKSSQKFKPIIQRKIASLNANAMIVGTPMTVKDQQRSLRPLGYKPPSTQALAQARTEVTNDQQRIKSNNDSSSLFVKGQNSPMVQINLDTAKNGENHYSQEVVLQTERQNHLKAQVEQEAVIQSIWNEQEALRREEMKLKSKFMSKGGGMHNFKERDAHIFQAKRESMQHQQVHLPAKIQSLVMQARTQRSQSQMHLSNLNYGLPESQISLGIPHADMFQLIGDDMVSTIPDDVYESEATHRNNMKHHWLHSSDHLQGQGPPSQEELDNSANSWNIKPVANIELIQQVDEEEEYSRVNSGTMLLNRENSVKSLRREGSRRAIKEQTGILLNPPRQQIQYIVSHRQHQEDQGSSKPHTSRRKNKQKGSQLRKNMIKKGSSKYSDAEINRLKAHIKPEKLTSQSISSNTRIPQEQPFRQNIQRTKQISTEQAFQAYSNQFQSSRMHQSNRQLSEEVNAIKDSASPAHSNILFGTPSVAQFGSFQRKDSHQNRTANKGFDIAPNQDTSLRRYSLRVPKEQATAVTQPKVKQDAQNFSLPALSQRDRLLNYNSVHKKNKSIAINHITRDVDQNELDHIIHRVQSKLERETPHTLDLK